MKLANLKPERVFYFFEEICSIPHGTGNTAKISEYCVNFAKKNDLEYILEPIGNVIIKKPASIGKEKSRTVVIQGHLDMVCEKTIESNIDFEKDGLDIFVENGFIRANGTTLGGDDGIAVAMCLALLEDKTAVHPQLEVLFTVDEETGMFGANALNSEHIDGRTLINIDSEEEGIFTVSCAGSIRSELILPITKISNTKNCVEITVEGLKGGHSGVDIHRGRLNSNKVMAAFLGTLDNFDLISIDGGFKDNAIPVYTKAVIATDEDVSALAENFAESIKSESDSALKISVTSAGKSPTCLHKNSTHSVVDFLNKVPNGIIKWSDNIENLVESSLNLGILKTTDDSLVSSFLVRSSVNGEKIRLAEELEDIIKSYGGKISNSCDNPAWEYNQNSPLRDKMTHVYKKMYGENPQVLAIHAGLECGLLSEKLSGLDAVSIGPNMYNIHTVKESLSIDSVERVYNYLLNLLKEI